MFYKPHIDILDLPCSRLHDSFDGLTLLHLSDLHVTRWTRRLTQWRDRLARLPAQPDMVVITGDLGHRSWLWKASLESVTRLLEPLRPPLGTFFILGNHDSVKLGPALAATRDSAGLPRVMLQNESIIITPDQFQKNLPSRDRQAAPQSPNLELSTQNLPRLALIGVHQHRRIDTDIPAALRGVNPGDFKLMLLHYPDLVHPAVACGADVCLAGHTHGGQICWPDGRPLFGQDTLPPAMCTGVHKVNGTWMVVNRGIGSAGLRMRLFCPPHAVLMTLRAGS